MEKLTINWPTSVLNRSLPFEPRCQGSLGVEGGAKESSELLHGGGLNHLAK